MKLFQKRVKTLPESAGTCPSAHAGRHVVAHPTGTICLLCDQEVKRD